MRLEETHSRRFELCRHFFLRFFDSELISDSSQTKVIAGGAVGILASVSLIFGQAYYHKYRMLLAMDSPLPYQHAVLGDVLFLVTLIMLASALFTTLQWHALFPGLRDYLALASLPVRMREIFLAKFAALLSVAMAVLTVAALPPSVIVVAMMMGQPYSGGYVMHVPGIFLASLAGGWFTFFALVAIQGALLNVLPPRLFPRVSLALQGVLLAALLIAAPFVFSIPNFYNCMDPPPPWSMYLPPFWFYGIDQIVFGARSPSVLALARTAVVALPASAIAAILTYIWSYHRHRVRVLESPSVESAAARALWPAALSEKLLPSTRTLGVFAFIAKNLARSRQHRLILIAFASLALALVSEGFSGVITGASRFSETGRQSVIAIPLALSLFLLAGLRYLFRLPVELRANWIFRITEPGHATELLSGVERFLLYWGAAPVAIFCLPLEMMLLRWRAGLASSAACFLLSLLLIEVLLFNFEKIPFTSSYLPGRKPLIETVLKYSIAAVFYVWVLAALVSFFTRGAAGSVVLPAVLAIAWWSLHRARLHSRHILRFEFDEQLEPAVQLLGIEKD